MRTPHIRHPDARSGTGPTPARQSRRGITLFEVVIALVIFTVTLPALNALVQIGTQRAVDSANLARASMECRSKLAEITVGAEDLNSTDWAPMPDANWSWKMNVTGGDVDGLKQVQVCVKFDNGAAPVQVTLSQFIIDPAMRGSTQDRALLSSNSANNNSNSSQSGDSGSSSSNSSSNSSSSSSNSSGGGTSSGQSGAGISGMPSSGSSKTGIGGAGSGSTGALPSGSGTTPSIPSGSSTIPSGSSGKGGS